jgi:hypothetical protein
MIESGKNYLQKISGELNVLKERVNVPTMAWFIKLNNRHIQGAHTAYSNRILEYHV